MKAIDLGLSVLWGDCNLGANSPEEQGRFCSWNNAVKKVYGQDIVGQLLGKGWRLPTYTEVGELLSGRFQPVSFDFGMGLKGIVVLGRNGNSIFLPSNSKGLSVTISQNANYWTSSIDGDDPTQASQFRFDTRGVFGGCNQKDRGQLILPVLDRNLI